MNKDHCHECKFFSPGYFNDPSECRRRAPVSISHNGELRRTFPYVKHSDWCFEFQASVSRLKAFFLAGKRKLQRLIGKRTVLWE